MRLPCDGCRDDTATKDRVVIALERVLDLIKARGVGF